MISKKIIDEALIFYNIELDKNVNVGIRQFVPILFKLNDTIILSFLKIDRS